MSGGATGLGGHIYQQDYVVFRILTSAVVGDGSDLTVRRIASYAIEGRSTPEGPVWDVSLSLADLDLVELRECKDTHITREDRHTFYRRIRREYAAGTDFDRLTAGWVTDPAKQGSSKILDHLMEMSRLASLGDAVLPCALPDRVDSGETALQEALFLLSKDTPAGDSPCLPVETAKELLSRLVVDTISAGDLRRTVETIAQEVLPQGTGLTIHELFIGNLTIKITSEGHTEGTVEEILSAVGGNAVLAKVRDGLREFLCSYSAVGPLPRKRVVCWEQLSSEPIEWPLAIRLPGLTLNRSCIIVGPQGSGKSTICTQAIHELIEHRDRHHVLSVNAGLFCPDFIRRLPGFVAILCGLSPTWIAIDELDRVGFEHRRAWEDCLGRLLALPGAVVFATAREEVMTAGEWLQRMTTSMRTLELGLLTDDQVREAFRRAGLAEPNAPDLLQVLRNPLLLSLYARIANHDSLLLGGGGRITAFLVIQEFWNRRVRTPSEGHRLVGSEDDSSLAKHEAIVHLVGETLRGSLVIGLPSGSGSESAGRGVQMLVREGVVIEHGSHAVRWYHDWIREYAIVDYLIAKIEQPAPDRLAELVTGIAVDHVARTATVGGAKWVITKEIWGPIEAYLAALHERRKGFASEALAALIEESPVHLRLANLTDALLLEAVGMARQTRARAWSGQVTSLPLDRFREGPGAQLLLAVNLYDLEMASDE